MDWAFIADIAAIITTVSLVIAVAQLIRSMKTQDLQSFFYIHNYLSQDEFSNARKKIRTELFCTVYSCWGDEEKKSANRVCASYDQAGLLISIGVLNKKTKREFLSSSWGRSIIDQYESLKPFLDDYQTPTQTGREFFKHFTWLYNEALKYQNRDDIV
jgi:hypothetical protein